MRNLIIVDPSLKDHRGHHFELSQLIATEAARLGMSVHLLANVDFLDVSFGPNVTIHKLFDFTMYDRYVGGADRSEESAGEASEVFADMLDDALSQCGATVEDIILCHTTDAAMFRNMLAYHQKFGAEALPLHLATPYDERVMPGKMADFPLGQTIAELKRIASGKVFFWAETTPLANHLSALWNARVEPLILPIKSATAPLKNPSSPTIELSYLGAAREEKGFTLLPDLIAGVLDEPACEPIRFFVQCSPQIIGYLPPIKAALARLEPLEGDRVALQREPMASDVYARVLEQSDGLLLLYDAANYRVRGSGIAWDGVTSGKVLVTRSDTFPASLLVHGGGVVADDIDGWIKGVVDLCRNWETQQAAVKAQAEFFAKWASAERYLERIATRPNREVNALCAPFALIRSTRPALLRQLGEAV
ncbi:MAG: hypothetical protein P8Q48_24100 [Paracoccaceae bacterium]|nr:hypothetical protein [Paracoccaceae bacterium]